MSSRHAVLMIAYQNVDLTKQAVQSVLAQDVPGGIDLFFVNNGSTDGTAVVIGDMFATHNVEGYIANLPANESPCKVANQQLASIFAMGYGEVLCVANDTILPPSMYGELLKWPRGIVTASEIHDRATYDEYVKQIPPVVAVSENTPMSLMLLRHWVWDAVVSRDGHFFDERIFNYVSDCDIALRIASRGIRGLQISYPYYHVVSATLKNMEPEARSAAGQQANEDRDYFARKWGFGCADFEYGACSVDINFRGEPKI